MTFDRIYIDEKGSVTIRVLAIMATAGALFPAASIFIAGYFTKYLRKKEYSMEDSKEYSFFRNYVLICAAVIATDLVYLYLRAVPFFKDALNEAILKIRIMHYQDEDIFIERINKAYDKCISATRTALVIICLVQAVLMFLGASALVKEYQKERKQNRS